MIYKGKIFELTLNTSWALVFCIDTHVSTISKGIGINKEKGMHLPKKQYISCLRCERTHVASKCQIFMNCSKTFTGICKEQV